MLTFRQIKDELPLINRIHIKQPRIRRMLGADVHIKPVDVDGTLAYVQQNIVRAREGRKCVDGRYPPQTASGMLARAGGDCGYVMALMAINNKKKLGLTPEQCFNAVFKVISEKMHGAFCMHTDQISDPATESANTASPQPLIGCGHLAKAATQGPLRGKYDVTNDDVKKIIAYARNLAEINDNVEIVNLNGEHQEQGVLLVTSDSLTVNAMDPKLHAMYFIYDKTRDEAFMKKLVTTMAV